ncbi:heme exporter protein CcmD [Thiorhodococcus minor]
MMSADSQNVRELLRQVGDLGFSRDIVASGVMEAAVDFFRQGGSAFFVWGAFGVTFLPMLAEVAQ